MKLFIVIIRTIFFYFFITISYRLMGKREVGQLGVIDLIVSILIAELVAISIENITDPMYLTIVPIGLLVLLEIVLAYISLKKPKLRALLEGRPSLIICNGKVNYHEMVKQRYTLDDLLFSLRQEKIRDIGDVEYAFLEANGKLSIFKYNIFKSKSPYPMPIIVDGNINEETLKHLKKDKSWLMTFLNVQKIKINEVFYAFYKNKKIYIIKKEV